MAMSETADRYAAWLEVPEGPRPPDHYTLLGLTRFESDTELIDQSATERMRKLRPLCMKFPAEATQLLNEVTKARLCLSDPIERAAYDAELRAAEAAPVASDSVVSSVAPEIETADSLAVTDDSQVGVPLAELATEATVEAPDSVEPAALATVDLPTAEVPTRGKRPMVFVRETLPAFLRTRVLPAAHQAGRAVQRHWQETGKPQAARLGAALARTSKRQRGACCLVLALAVLSVYLASGHDSDQELAQVDPLEPVPELIPIVEIPEVVTVEPEPVPEPEPIVDAVPQAVPQPDPTPLAQPTVEPVQPGKAEIQEALARVKQMQDSDRGTAMEWRQRLEEITALARKYPADVDVRDAVTRCQSRLNAAFVAEVKLQKDAAASPRDWNEAVLIQLATPEGKAALNALVDHPLSAAVFEAVQASRVQSIKAALIKNDFAAAWNLCEAATPAPVAFEGSKLRESLQSLVKDAYQQKEVDFKDEIQNLPPDADFAIPFNRIQELDVGVPELSSEKQLQNLRRKVVDAATLNWEKYRKKHGAVKAREFCKQLEQFPAFASEVQFLVKTLGPPIKTPDPRRSTTDKVLTYEQAKARINALSGKAGSNARRVFQDQLQDVLKARTVAKIVEADCRFAIEVVGQPPILEAIGPYDAAAAIATAMANVDINEKPPEVRIGCGITAAAARADLESKMSTPLKP